MAVEEKIADLLYALEEICLETDDARIQSIAGSMKKKAMKMGTLAQVSYRMKPGE